MALPLLALGVGGLTAAGDWLSGKYRSITTEEERRRRKELEDLRNRIPAQLMSEQIQLQEELGAPMRRARYELAGDPGAILQAETAMQGELGRGRRAITKGYNQQAVELGSAITDVDKEIEAKKAAERQRRSETLLNPVIATGASYLSNFPGGIKAPAPDVTQAQLDVTKRLTPMIPTPRMRFQTDLAPEVPFGKLGYRKRPRYNLGLGGY